MNASVERIAVEVQALVERIANERKGSVDLRAIIRARRTRNMLFPPDLFREPAWNMLLDLMLARLEGRLISVSSLCIASGVPASTALRWINILTHKGLLVRARDQRDGRRSHLELSPVAIQAMSGWMASCSIS